MADSCEVLPCFTKPPAYAVCLDKCGSEHYHAFTEDHLESAEPRQ